MLNSGGAISLWVRDYFFFLLVTWQLIDDAQGSQQLLALALSVLSNRIIYMQITVWRAGENNLNSCYLVNT